jgi:hypothetical protein
MIITLHTRDEYDGWGGRFLADDDELFHPVPASIVARAARALRAATAPEARTEHCDDCRYAQPNITTHYGQRLCPQCILTPGWADDYDPATDSIDGLDYADWAYEAWRDRSLDA